MGQAELWGTTVASHEDTGVRFEWSRGMWHPSLTGCGLCGE